MSLVAAVTVVAVGLKARTGSLDTADTAVVRAGHTPAYAAKNAATVR